MARNAAVARGPRIAIGRDMKTTVVAALLVFPSFAVGACGGLVGGGAGTLTVAGQTLFLSIDGGPTARYFFACDAPSTAPSSASSSSTPHATIATGTFGDCSSSAGVQITGGVGSVTLTQTDATVTAT